MVRKSGKKPKPARRGVRKRTAALRDPEAVPPFAETLKELTQNRPGLIGFSLSICQLLGHSSWILLTWYLQTTGKAKHLTSASWQSWMIVGIFGVSLLLTVVSLFICLFFGLRRSPRILAIIGFGLSFFVGVLATAVVFMSALRSMSG